MHYTRRGNAPPTKAQIDFLVEHGEDYKVVQRWRRAQASKRIAEILKVKYPQRIDVNDIEWEDEL